MDDVLVSKPLDSLNPPSSVLIRATANDSSSAVDSQSLVVDITKEQGVHDNTNALQNQSRPLERPVSRPRGRPPSRPSAEAIHITIEKPNVDTTVVASNWLQATSSEKHTSKQKKSTADLPESHVQTRAR